MPDRWKIAAPLLAAMLALVATMGGCSTLGLGSDSPVIDRIQQRGELRVGMTGDYPPLNLINTRGELIGLEPDLARALAATLKVELVVVQKPFDQLIEALESGEVDAIMAGMTMTPERNMSVAFAGPYFISGKAVLTRSRSLAGTDSAAQLDRSRPKLVALSGTTSETFVRQAVPHAELVTAPSYEIAIEMVIAGRADAMVADYPICVTAVLQNPTSGLVSAITTFTSEPIGVAVSKRDLLFANLVQNYLNSLEGTGLLTQLRAKWFDDAEWLAELPGVSGTPGASIYRGREL